MIPDTLWTQKHFFLKTTNQLRNLYINRNIYLVGKRERRNRKGKTTKRIYSKISAMASWQREARNRKATERNENVIDS